jgi:Glycosyl transferase family 2.
LNEDSFIHNFINSLYPFVSGISIITQYDRDYYSHEVIPDSTVCKVLSFPDPEGKIHLVVRRFKDEAAARNHEILSLITQPSKNIQTHGVPKDVVDSFYKKPDYFLIADADEIYEPETLPAIIEYLTQKKPNGMRITGYNYMWKWNYRVPITHEHFNHFGFIKSKFLFESKRIISWNEFRLRKLFSIFHLPDISSKIYNFINCPIETGVFHHGTYVGSIERIQKKISKHSHQEIKNDSFIENLKRVPTDYIPTDKLPLVLSSSIWPEGFIEI